MNKNFIFFSTRKGLNLAKKIVDYYGISLGKISFLKFSDGEYEISFEESIRGCQVFLIGSTFPPADNLMELLLMCDTAKRASAKNITVIIPYFGWARQDKKDKPRSSLGAKLVANLITYSGATRIITMDLHKNQIQGFFEIPIDHISAFTIFINYINKLNLNELIIASPDIGGIKRAKNYALYLNTDIVFCYKERKKANQIEYMNLIGNVKNKNIIIIDDIIDTAQSITLAAKIMKEKGAKTIRAMATHPILSGRAYEEIENSLIEELIVMDTIPIKKKIKKIRILSSAYIFSKVIDSISKNKSINSKFII